MADMAWRYPLARRRRRSRWRGWARRAATVPHGRWVAAAVLVAAMVFAGVTWHGRRADPAQAFREGLAAFREGRFEAARVALVAALPVEPARAQVGLARIAIERGDGAAAEIALQRAVAAGFPLQRLHQLRAAAHLLSGDGDDAIAEAGLAGPAYRDGADRVRARALAQEDDIGDALAILAAVVARSPRDPGAWSDLGAVRLVAAGTAAAGEAAARALSIDPRAPAALVVQGRVTRLRYGPAAALPWFAAAAQRDPRFLAALVEQAATLGEIGRSVEALAAARAALAAAPADPRPFYILATIAARAGRPALTRRLLQPIKADAMPGALLLGGWAEQADGHPDLAIARWQRLLDRQPRNLVVRRLLAAALLRSGDARSALDMTKPIATRGDADGYALEIAARAARAVGRADLAAVLHDRATGDRRQIASAFASGAEVATLAAAAEAGSPDAVVALIRGRLAQRDGPGAIADAQRLVRGAPGVAAAHLVLGDALTLGGRGAEAPFVYAHAADLAFDEPTLLRMIDALARAGRSRDAATTLALYLAQNPDSLTARRIAGHWQMAAGSGDAIATLARLAVMTGGRETAVLADLAVALADGGDGARALRLARAAYRLTPLRLDVVQAYATVLARTGNEDGARQLRAKAVAVTRMGG